MESIVEKYWSILVTALVETLNTDRTKPPIKGFIITAILQSISLRTRTSFKDQSSVHYSFHSVLNFVRPAKMVDQRSRRIHKEKTCLRELGP